ncbi:unnamed protein product [Polarella glacialis]|uniref:Uncharacterized protein n=1 Tax=Polarella glacialis TaxID=89957 RepID=A0A813LML4_POLGL|nr:unnamed protein product [Polarella glacialis]
MKSATSRVVLLLSVAGSAKSLTWVKAGNGSQAMCAGVETDCNDAASCTRVAFGPCGGVASPEFYFQAEVHGFAFINTTDSAYLTNMQELKGSAIANNNYRAIDSDLTAGDATYARITAGQYVGTDPSVSGGYIGMASYLLKKGTISINQNDFLVPDGPLKSTTTSKKACIAELNTTTSTCGAALTYKTGDFKFSLFGFTTGSSFALPSGVTYLGIRTKLTKKNFPADVEVTFNGKAKTLAGLTAIGTSDVTSVELTGTNRSLTMNFPQKYNVGDITDVGEASTPTATKDVKIKVAAVDGDADSIYVDYLFDAADFKAAKKYFVYDPTVSEVSTAVSTGSGLAVVSEAALARPALLALGILIAVSVIFNFIVVVFAVICCCFVNFIFFEP